MNNKTMYQQAQISNKQNLQSIWTIKFLNHERMINNSLKCRHQNVNLMNNHFYHNQHMGFRNYLCSFIYFLLQYSLMIYVYILVISHRYIIRVFIKIV